MVAAVHRLVQCCALFLALSLPGEVRAGVPAPPREGPVEAELRAGVASVDITPPRGFRMSGYFSERLNTGTHDPLRAKALVLAQGESSAALVFCDLIGMSPAVTRHARDQASAKTGIPRSHIAISATHSHTGPLYFGALHKHFHERAIAGGGPDPHEEVDYGRVLTEKLVEVIAAAQVALQPVELRAGVAPQEPQLSFNRRFHMRDGSVRFNPGQQNPDIVRVAGPIDPDVGIVALGEPGGNRVFGLLTVFAMHLDTVGGTEYSADYPHHLEEALRKSLGGDLLSLFGAGTCGDINHIDVSVQGRRGTAEMGNLLAETVLGHLPSLPAVSDPSLAVRSESVEAPLQKTTPDRVADAARKMAKIGTRDLAFLEQVEAAKVMDLELRRSPTLTLEVQVFRLGRDLAIVTLPGEVFVELGLAIKRGSPFATTLVVELTNDTPAYIPTEKAFAEGSYETVNSRVVPGSGERMVEAALRMLRDLAP